MQMNFLTYKTLKAFKTLKALTALLAITALTTPLVSCTDDVLDVNEGSPSTDPSLGSTDGNSLAFTISLPSMQSGTRAVVNYPGTTFDETYEDYVDPSQMYIFFINNEDSEYDHASSIGEAIAEDGDNVSEGESTSSAGESNRGKIIKMLYTGADETSGSRAITLIPIEDSAERDYINWYFRLSFTELQEQNGMGDELARILRTTPFKIAVLANAPGDPLKVDDAFKNYATTGKINYGDANHINVLHHQTTADQEPYYNTDGKTNKTETYQFLYNNNPYNEHGFLGLYSDWVKNKSDDIEGMTVNSENTARNFIRENWNPSTDKFDNFDNLDIYTTLWSLWNFGGDIANNQVPYGTTQTGDNYSYKMKYASQWEERNGNYLRDILENTGNDGIISSFSTTDIRDENDEPKPDPTPLSFVAGNNATAIYDEANGFYGIKLPRITWPENKDRIDDTNEDFKGYFHFTAHATGYLFVTARHSGNKTDNSIKLLIQKGYSPSSQNFTFGYASNGVPYGVRTLSQKISITGNSEEIYLYVGDSTNESNSLEIYQIEYIEDKYLYDTNRIGKSPENQYIPMYGIQSFPALAPFWEEGTLFDLTNFNNLTGADFNNYSSTVPLLRSVAKVELRIPTSLNAEHVYLRSLNRKGRWEPLNVFTDTYDIWKDHDIDNKFNHSKECEWFSIRYHKTFFEGKDYQAASQFADYKKKLAWYYADWAIAKPETEDGVEVSSLWLDDVKVPELNYCDDNGLRGWTHDVYHSKANFDGSIDNPGYPRVMNALIDRSDFCEFLYAGVDGIYDRYVLYVPEKYVDDPNDVGEDEKMLSSDPKVCHIEFRLEEDDDFNLDDNKCYRIYFIENGFNEEMEIPNLSNNAHTWEEMYEQSVGNLQKHWPIMRDHCYSFTVKDVNNNMVIVKLEVLPWRKIDDISITW